MNSARPHTDLAHHEGDTPTESMVTLSDRTTVILPGPHLPPTPIVMERKAADVAFMSPEVLREKLRALPHRSPDVQMTSEEAQERARIAAGLDPDEETESMRRFLRARDAYRKELSRGTAGKWEKVLVLVMIALSVAVTAAVIWKELAG